MTSILLLDAVPATYILLGWQSVLELANVLMRENDHPHKVKWKYQILASRNVFKQWTF